MKNFIKSIFLQKQVIPFDEMSQREDRLLAINDMEKKILRERSRSDRNDHEFSVIVIDIEKFNHENGLIDHLVQLMWSRLRMIDEIGWYAKRQLGIVLPYTSPENAVQVAEDLLKIIRTETPATLSKILSYPSIWPFKK